MFWKQPKEIALITASQVFRRLADLELEGLSFYEGLHAGTKSERVRELAEYMIHAEKRHRRRFLHYATHVEKNTDPDKYVMSDTVPPQVAQAMMADLFPPGMAIRKSAQYSQDAELIMLAIRAEEQTALLLTQLRMYVPKEHQRYVSRVIKEEWGHKARLEGFLAKQGTDRS